MTTFLNLLLALLGLTLGILAIGGETWNKRQQGLRKVTFKGWICIVLLLMSFGVGVTKEVLDAHNGNERESKAKKRDEAYAQRNQQLERMLQAANSRLRQSPRPINSAFVNLEARITRVPFEVYAEDVLEYTVTGTPFVMMNAPFKIKNPVPFSASLKVANITIPMRADGGRITIPGIPNRPMTSTIETEVSGAQLKMTLISTR